MKKFKLLLYEDDPDWKESFIYNISARLEDLGVQIRVLHKLDGDTVMQDIEWLPDLILVDYDLGVQTGVEVIDQIEQDPQFNNTSIFFYSGGESIETLSGMASKFKCGVSCYIKDGVELEQAVISQATN